MSRAFGKPPLLQSLNHYVDITGTVWKRRDVPLLARSHPRWRNPLSSSTSARVSSDELRRPLSDAWFIPRKRHFCGFSAYRQRIDLRTKRCITRVNGYFAEYGQYAGNYGRVSIVGRVPAEIDTSSFKRVSVRPTSQVPPSTSSLPVRDRRRVKNAGAMLRPHRQRLRAITLGTVL